MAQQGSDAFRIAERSRVEAALDRMAARIYADHGAEVALVGILRRGGPLAEALGERISELAGGPIDVDTIKLKRYADDLSLIHDEPELEESPMDFEVEGRTLVLVDDVLYSGRTVLRAVNYFNEMEAEAIHVAVLCSRGPNEVPVVADYVAMQLDVGEGAIIKAHVPPYEDDLGVVLRRRCSDEDGSV